jgi:hypothetical protein
MILYIFARSILVASLVVYCCGFTLVVYTIAAPIQHPKISLIIDEFGGILLIGTYTLASLVIFLLDAWWIGFLKEHIYFLYFW